MTTTKKMMVVLALAPIFAGGGCDDEVIVNSDSAVFSDAGLATATVTGYAWDPEIFWYVLATCAPPGQMCNLPPLILPNTPIYSQAAVSGAAVGLFDPLQPTQTMPLPFASAGLSGFDGGWVVTGVPLRSNPPFFAVAAVPPGGMGVDGGVPGTNYLPTFNMKPIGTAKTTLCLSQPAGLVGDSGVLEAVAKYRTIHGNPTEVKDLLDPTKTAGVAVWWLWIPGAASLKVPAFGASVKADIGDTYTLSWLPPGIPAFAALQSARGFFVNNDFMGMAPGAAPGVSVVVLPPLTSGGAPPTVTFTAGDPVMDEKSGRPYRFTALPPSQIPPGLISLGELQGLSDGAAAAPPDWVCLP
jgi:hypothetical protein